jgi:tripartite-type tricarboxylate transporter receptor subunit TctC
MKRLCTLLLAMALAWPAAAQDYPSRPVQMIIPFPPGGNTDLMARALQQELSRILGGTVVAVNRGGAAGTVGNREVHRATPDGHTIGLSPNNALTTQPHLQPNTYAVEQFRHICGVYENPYVVVIGRNAPFRDFAGMIAHARTGPEALVYGAPGLGSTPHLVMAQLLRRAGVSGLFVSYQGAGPMAQGALAGDIMVFAEAATIPASTGLGILAAIDHQRMPSLPDVPSVAELGLPMRGSTYGGLIAPAGLPDAVAQRLEQACETAVRSEPFQAAARRLNAEPSFTSGAAFRTRLVEESQANQALMLELGIGR